MTNQRPLVLYHGGGCRDGFCAAFLFHLALPKAEIVPVNYGGKPPECQDREVYLLDFCYPVVELEQMAAQAVKVTVLDHHKTALEALEGWSHPRVEVYPCKAGRSGAGLAWEYLKKGLKEGRLDLSWSSYFDYKDGEIPWYVAYVQDRDLWKFELPASRQYNAFLQTWPLVFDDWRCLAQSKELEDHVVFAKQGGTILRIQGEQVATHLPHAWPIIIQGKRGLIVNATVLQSEIAGALAQRSGVDFGACFTLTEQGTVHVSLRSVEKSGTDVSALAQIFPGGGGHKNAAGFRAPVQVLEQLKVAVAKKE